MSLKRVLIYGARGALGSACASLFKSKNWWVGCVDVRECDGCDVSVCVPADSSMDEQAATVSAVLQEKLGNHKLDAILCVAGGWAGGGASSKNMLKNSDLMWRQSVCTSLVCARLASQFLQPQGLLQLTGAQAALSPTPGMLGYGIAKSAVHDLTGSLAVGDACGGGHVMAILPTTLDTPANRACMPTADRSNWTSLDYVAQLLFEWAEHPQERPKSGSLVQLITTGGATVQKID